MARRQITYILCCLVGIAAISGGLGYVFNVRYDSWPLDLALFLLPVSSSIVSFCFKNKPNLLVSVILTAIFALGFFAGDYMVPAPFVYLSLWGGLLFAQKYVVAWLSFIIAAISLYATVNYGVTIASGEAYLEKLLINISYIAMTSYPALRSIRTPNDPAGKEQSSLFVEKKAA